VQVDGLRRAEEVAARNEVDQAAEVRVASGWERERDVRRVRRSSALGETCHPDALASLTCTRSDPRRP